MKVAIYARVSTDDKGQDPQVQIEKCRKYCELYNHQIVGEFVDMGVSGDTYYYDRPEGKKLYELVKSNKVDAIIVFSIDRFSRQNPVKILNLINNLNIKGIKFISVTEPIFNMESEYAEPMRFMLSWFSNYFLVQHKKKVSAGIEKAKKFGTKTGNPIGRRRVADYEKITELWKRGFSISKISKMLNCSKSSVKNAISSCS